jgi:hypothetical protein
MGFVSSEISAKEIGNIYIWTKEVPKIKNGKSIRYFESGSGNMQPLTAIWVCLGGIIVSHQFSLSQRSERLRTSSHLKWHTLSNYKKSCSKMYDLMS